MSKISIQVKGVNISYERKRVLSNIYLDIEQGYIYGVIGPNGAGKSTLFKTILGLIEPNSGSVTVLDNDITKARKRVAYVPQKDGVDWDFPATVYDIVQMGRYPHKKVLQKLNGNDHAITQEALEKVGMTEYSKRQIGALSGGQQQRVFIARALCQQADIFLLDEPFVGVDITTEHKTIDILKELTQQNKTVMIVHHDLATADNYFDKVILLNQRLIAYGDTSKVFTKENIAKTYASQLNILHQVGMREH
ncbi:MAG: metal ABC transporter ATP-binding protein [Saprospiraceae bacterium]